MDRQTTTCSNTYHRSAGNTSTSPETTFGPKQGCHSIRQTASAFLGNLPLKLRTSLRSWLGPRPFRSASSHEWRREFNLLFRFHILIRHDLASRAESRGWVRVGEISLGLAKAQNQYALPSNGKSKAEQFARAGLSTSTAHRYGPLVGE